MDETITPLTKTNAMSVLTKRIERVAAKADLNQKSVKWLLAFFIGVESQEDVDNLDLWLHERKANDKFFDLMLKIDKDRLGTAPVATIHNLIRNNANSTKDNSKFISKINSFSILP